MSTVKARINHQIRATELRVIGAGGENLGVLPIHDALVQAELAGLDLIEVSPDAKPPVAKIMDFGKYQYAENKKQKQAKAKSKKVEIKTIQIKVGTGEHDLALKAKKISEWLTEGNRIKIDLFLVGRSKYMDPKFLEERLKRVLVLITENYKIADPTKRGPKGLSTIIERA